MKPQGRADFSCIYELTEGPQAISSFPAQVFLLTFCCHLTLRLFHAFVPYLPCVALINATLSSHSELPQIFSLTYRLRPVFEETT